MLYEYEKLGRLHVDNGDCGKRHYKLREEPFTSQPRFQQADRKRKLVRGKRGYAQDMGSLHYIDGQQATQSGAGNCPVCLSNCYPILAPRHL